MKRPNLNEDSNDLLDQVEYLIELEKYCDFIETENEQLKLCEVVVTLPTNTKLWVMAKTIVEKQKATIDIKDKKKIDWEMLEGDWFDWLEEEINGN